MPAVLTSVTDACSSLDRLSDKGFQNRYNARLPIRLRFLASVHCGRPRLSATVVINIEQRLACCAGRWPAAGVMDSKASRKSLGLMGAALLRRGSHPVLHAGVAVRCVAGDCGAFCWSWARTARLGVCRGAVCRLPAQAVRKFCSHAACKASAGQRRQQPPASVMQGASALLTRSGLPRPGIAC